MTAPRIALLLFAVFVLGILGAIAGNALTGDPTAQGPAGPPGADGAPGADGDDGADGSDGASGDVGLSGPPGLNGARGSTGPAGAQGTTGPKGSAGAQGVAGPAGVPGVDGIDGADGTEALRVTFLEGPITEADLSTTGYTTLVSLSDIAAGSWLVSVEVGTLLDYDRLECTLVTDGIAPPQILGFWSSRYSFPGSWYTKHAIDVVDTTTDVYFSCLYEDFPPDMGADGIVLEQIELRLTRLE